MPDDIDDPIDLDSVLITGFASEHRDVLTVEQMTPKYVSNRLVEATLVLSESEKDGLDQALSPDRVGFAETIASILRPKRPAADGTA